MLRPIFAATLMLFCVGCAATAPVPSTVPANEAVQSAPQSDIVPLTSIPERAALTVGAGQKFTNIRDAAAAAKPFDRIEIHPGAYEGCVVWPAKADHLTVTGLGRVVVTGTACQDKALFVVQSRAMKIKGIVFTGAHASAHNGAGIRAENVDLTVEDSQFVDNQEGILAGAAPGSTIIIRNSRFEKNGNCIAECAHGIYINKIARLRVENCRFIEQYVGHHIKSRALRTEIVDNVIHDGPTGTSSFLIDIPVGGSVLISGNDFEKGVNTSNDSAAISIGGEGESKGMNDTPSIEVTNNVFVNDNSKQTVFVYNHSAMPATLENNRFSGGVIPLKGPGTTKSEISSLSADNWTLHYW